jgi:hypothetical protein
VALALRIKLVTIELGKAHDLQPPWSPVTNRMDSVSCRASRRSLLALVLSGAIYAGGAVLLTWPLGRHLTDHVIAHAGNESDSMFVAWLLAWVFHALTHFPLRLFQANILYPAPDALGFSDRLLGDQLLFAPVYAATGNPVLALNITVLATFVLNGLSAAFLARHITGRMAPALLAGFVYAFAPLRFSRLMHLQLLSTWWAPLAFLALDRWLREPRSSRIVGAVLAAWFQFPSSAYLGVMLVMLFVPYALRRGWPDRRRLLRPQPLRQAGLACVLGIVLFLPVAIPYLRSADETGCGFG